MRRDPARAPAGPRLSEQPPPRTPRASWWTCPPEEWPTQHAKAVERMVGSREADRVHTFPSLSGLWR